ncbi:sulfurtransferase [Litchfieldia salsa]|uniref:Thiosulfate/3-mercaptopyruvate sulfurtransferase n=1 Tax=Litchfieldia salsa TaxID=930152 RepID=A0A1H0TI74_9BACI|nr:sulfurtransferase [Litchfieldia salsa]SDP53545.1 thiosulfate/3-mercaptopyruvate sulfurtransferase [Litchfieldia salsa]
MFKNVVSIEWLKEQLGFEDLRIIDCRFDLANPTKGLDEYIESHLPGSLYFNLDVDLSSEVQKHGGRHPLPEIENFVKKIEAAGISPSTKVVVYDNQGGGIASRLWWLLRFIGHTRVFVLEGGYSSWVREGYPITKDVPIFQKVSYSPVIQHQMIATIDDVKRNIKDQTSFLIDSREELRYLGIEEPIDNTAGHIPGALNFFWKDVLEGSKYKGKNELEAKFSSLNKESEVIVYCGSGVTACPNILMLNELDFDNVKLYAGSWSDWISYPDNPIAKSKE